ncbi:MAG: YbaK/EbsC family protein [Ruminococcus sp.]
MIHVKDITKITGYVRGGCSPIGMKKPFPTVFDASAGNFQGNLCKRGESA